MQLYKMEDNFEALLYTNIVPKKENCVKNTINDQNMLYK
jgi:hypothetical protein